MRRLLPPAAELEPARSNIVGSGRHPRWTLVAVLRLDVKAAAGLVVACFRPGLLQVSASFLLIRLRV
jgi:hypothetical protein